MSEKTKLNPFKVGDRVRAFGVRDGGLLRTFIDANVVDPTDSGGFLTISSEPPYPIRVHEKQCRRLVKNKGRTLWIRDDPVWVTIIDGPWIRTTMPPDPENWIYVREVKKK